MSAFGGVSNFFYNVIPGVLFLLVLDFKVAWFELQDLPGDTSQELFWIIILGLFLGFSGQATAKLLKDIAINSYVFNNIKKDNSTEYKDAVTKLSKIGISTDEIKNIFYSMDNNLRNKETNYIINHYSERAAFWANISLGLLIISFVLFCEGRVTEAFNFILLLIFARIFWFSSIKSQYESILQTFLQKAEE